MKGTILRCVAEVVRERFGEDKWKAILVKSGFEDWRTFSTLENVSDDETLALIFRWNPSDRA